MRLRIAQVGGVLGLVAASVALAFTAPLGPDYVGGPCDGVCDFAGPPITALLHGHLSQFVDTQGMMGPFSLLLRAPLAALASALHGGILWEYRVGALPCLLALALLAGWLWQMMARRGQSVVARLFVVGLCLASPMTFKALSWGHPEELLAAAMCVGAVILATRGRSLSAGLLLGLAVATKQWALLAVLPVLLAATEDRIRMLVVAGLAAAVFVGPVLIADPGHFFTTQAAISEPQADRGITPTNVWWPYAHVIHADVAGGGSVDLSYGLSPALNKLAHPLVLVIAIVLPLLYWWRRPDRRPEDALALLALIFLLRCMLDPLTYSYHHAPFLIALVAYEAIVRRGIPVLAIVAGAALWLTGSVIAPTGDPDLLNRFYILWTLPFAVYLVLTLFFPAQATSLDRRLRLARPLDAATA
jgi:glycosyl transferase family 87